MDQELEIMRDRNTIPTEHPIIFSQTIKYIKISFFSATPAISLLYKIIKINNSVDMGYYEGTVNSVTASYTSD